MLVTFRHPSPAAYKASSLNLQVLCPGSAGAPLPAQFNGSGRLSPQEVLLRRRLHRGVSSPLPRRRAPGRLRAQSKDPRRAQHIVTKRKEALCGGDSPCLGESCRASELCNLEARAEESPPSSTGSKEPSRGWPRSSLNRPPAREPASRA